METFLSNEIIKDLILPFVLVFTLIFAVLEKSKLLGDGKQQINAIISFVIGALVVAGFQTQVGWLQKFSVFLAVAIFIYFVFMLIFAFAVGAHEGDPFKGYDRMKYILGAIAFVSVAVASLVITDTWDKVVDFFTEGTAGGNVIMIIVIIAVVVAVMFGGKKTEGEKKA